MSEAVLEEKLKVYKELRQSIEELEERKKCLADEILQLLPKETKTVHVGEYQVRRMARLSIRTSLESARTLGAVKMEESVDKEKLKELLKLGVDVPDVSEIQYIQVSLLAKEEVAESL